MGRQRGGRHATETFDIDTGTARLEPVAGEPDSWVLWVNDVPSSAITLGDPERLDFEYLDWMARLIETRFDPAAPQGRAAAPRGRALRFVHIGAAGCALPRWVTARYPQARQTAIDIDARLLAYVREWFDLPRSPQLALRAGDGAEQLATFPDAGLDVVVRDAFAGDTTPAQLADADFFALAAGKLRDSGLLLANIADRPPHAALRAEMALLRRSFAHVALAADPGQVRGRRWGNVVAIAAHTTLDDIGMAKALRRGPAQATVLSGKRLDSYAGLGRTRAREED